MNRVAIVVQRCHESIVGGSESLAWQYATLLKDDYETEVLTTTALDTAYWTNKLPAGVEWREGVRVRRFQVTTGRSIYWAQLHDRLKGGFSPFAAGGRRRVEEAVNGDFRLGWSVPLQEEFILHQGPYSEPLVEFIKEHWPEFHAIIFVTYLYPTTYFGLLQLPAGTALLAPTLHDEQPAYLSAYKHMAERAHSLIWLTHAEQRVTKKLWGDLTGRVVAMGIDTRLRRPARARSPYLLYCGRIDPNKGFPELFNYFIKYKAYHPSSLRLVLTGIDDLAVPEHPEIEFRGFVPEEEKFRLMAGAKLYVMPSRNESFSIVTLEAMAQQTAVVASAESEVLADHLRQSGAGLTYRDYESFAAALEELLPDRDKRLRMGQAGRRYVLENYRPERIRAALVEAVEEAAQSKPQRRRETAAPAPSTSSARGFKDERAVKKLSDDRLLNAPPLPLPSGWSEEALREWLASVLVEGGPAAEMRGYAMEDFKRFVYTLGLVPQRPHLDVLELGANPYFMTTLLYKFRQARLHLANFFGHPEKEAVQNVTILQTGEVIEYPYKQFNIEEDSFPYEDATIDVVLFCEIIEHLLSDPVHALVEIRRVLRPGGTLVITTPNVARLDNVCKIIGGENIYDPYSGYGPYGRHNREYNKHDLHRLLTANGFRVEQIFSADVHDRYADTYAQLEQIKPLVRHRAADLGQYIFCQSTVAEGARSAPVVRPDWLYRSYRES
ncbi:MAG TPA: glycosyltransferase [Pyrinomonadaceae bacterium]|jgi:glycosyltransferase involved in cell wall biosynthesis/SAM-dependent methyltransferase